MWSGRIIWRSSGKRWCRDVTTHVSWMLEPGLLMRPEHNETQAKTETRECETEIETETETKNLLWDRDQKLRDRDQSSQLQVKVTQIGMFHFFYYTHEVNDEPEMDFAFKMISE